MSGTRHKSATPVVERRPLKLSREDLPTPTATVKDEPCCPCWDLHEAAASDGGGEAVRRYLISGGDTAADQWGNSALHVRENPPLCLQVCSKTQTYGKICVVGFSSLKYHRVAPKCLEISSRSASQHAGISMHIRTTHRRKIHIMFPQVAAYEGNVDVVKVLLGYNAHVEQRNRAEETPLHLACRQGHTQVVRLLLENGADPRLAHRVEPRGIARSPL